MKKIPQNNLFKQTGLGDIFGDIYESFNIDLLKNIGAISTTRTINVLDPGDFSSSGDNVYAFEYNNSQYYAIVNEDLYYSVGDSPDSLTTKVTDVTVAGTFDQYSDIKSFNGYIYATISNDIYKGVLNTWTSAATNALSTTTDPHLMEVLGDRLYITDANTKVVSLDTSDTIATTGSYTLDTGLDSTQWIITRLVAYNNSLWVFANNRDTHRGVIFEWDGQTENTPNNRWDVSAGIMSACVSANTLYAFNSRGKMLQYNGSFIEVGGLYTKKQYYFNDDNTALLNYVRPQGMCAGENGSVYVNVSNILGNNQFNDETPSGVYQYIPDIGFIHKYSPSNDGNYGYQRYYKSAGAILYAPPASDVSTNGTILIGAQYRLNSNTTTNDSDFSYGIFCDDTDNAQPSFGYLVTSKIFSPITANWARLYTLFKKFISTEDYIVIKYRTSEDVPTEFAAHILDIDRVTTTDDVSDYEQGDDIQFIQGAGSGFVSTIKSITEDSGTYTIIFEDELPTGAIGLSGRALLSKWKYAGRITSDNTEQYKETTLDIANSSPWIQLRVLMYFNTTGEVYSFYLDDEKQIST